jgi:hypothetical protein
MPTLPRTEDGPWTQTGLGRDWHAASLRAAGRSLQGRWSILPERGPRTWAADSGREQPLGTSTGPSPVACRSRPTGHRRTSRASVGSGVRLCWAGGPPWDGWALAIPDRASAQVSDVVCPRQRPFRIPPAHVHEDPRTVGKAARQTRRDSSARSSDREHLRTRAKPGVRRCRKEGRAEPGTSPPTRPGRSPPRSR